MAGILPSNYKVLGSIPPQFKWGDWLLLWLPGDHSNVSAFVEGSNKNPAICVCLRVFASVFVTPSQLVTDVGVLMFPLLNSSVKESYRIIE